MCVCGYVWVFMAVYLQYLLNRKVVLVKLPQKKAFFPSHFYKIGNVFP